MNKKSCTKRFIERFHSRGHLLCKFIGTKESVCVTKEFNSHRVVLVHQHGRRFIVLKHQKHKNIKTRNGVSEHQDFKIFWENMPPASHPIVAHPFNTRLGMIRPLLKKHDFIYLNGRTACFNIILSKSPWLPDYTHWRLHLTRKITKVR